MRILILALLASALALGGCDRMTTSHSAQLAKDAQGKAADGDYLHAITLYESALADPARNADIHYQLGVLYDDKMKDPLSALHHFKRCLTLAPAGAHAAEVKKFMKDDELALLTSLSGDSVMTRAEATRLKNENLSLRQQVEDTWAKARAAAAKEKPTRAAKPVAKASPAKKRTRH